jgi:nucleoside-diphosphate-sugar epimerase
MPAAFRERIPAPLAGRGCDVTERHEESMDHVLTPASRVLLTGATGLIGGEILRRLEGQCAYAWSLVRPKDGEGPAARLAARYRRSGDFAGPGPSVEAVAGDVAELDWGLAPADRDRICDGVDLIIHNAADTSFAAHRDTGKTNIESVERLVELAGRCRRRPLIVYMGTATNVGRVTGACLGEDAGCRLGDDHFNEYTRSKAVAEATLRASGLPVLTLRPSIVLGAGLPDPGFAKQILWCVPLTRCFRGLPIDPVARLDLADVGFVADATLALVRCRHRHWDCYHISAGPGGTVSTGRMRQVVDEMYRRKKPLQLIPPAEWTREHIRQYVRSPLQKRVFRSLRHYLPFLNMDVVYDNSRLIADLGDQAPRLLSAADYLPDLVRLIRPRAALREAAMP